MVPRESTPAIHHAAAKGFSSKADVYAAGRPDYPAQLDEWLRKTLEIDHRKMVLDLGSGTGKFLPRLMSTGAKIVAVEPIAAMRAQLRARYPNVDAREGTAEKIPLGDHSVDAVTCAQAFHWFATRESLAEIRRVLKPNGALGLIWNIRDESVGWVAALTRIVAPYEGDAPRYYAGEWRHMFPAQGFTSLQEASFSYAHAGSPEQVIVDRMMSVSFIAALPIADQDRVAAQIRELIASSPDLAGKATVAMPYRTVAFSCRKVY
jgi:SAM-dependent methyltransferase